MKYNTIMAKRISIYALLSLLAMAIGLSSCNEKSSEQVLEGDFGNVSITSFNLKADNTLLANLDSVFFSIDLANATIYNADSLPMGLDVSHLLINIGTPTISGCDVTFRPAGLDRDSVVDYLKSPSDSIDFSQGPVTIAITSYDRQVTRKYTVNVNVHKVAPDSLTWGDMALGKLPTKFSQIDGSKTVEYQGKALCVTSCSGAYAVAVNANPDQTDAWVMADASLPPSAKLETLTATDDALYIVDNQGVLYKSTDLCRTFVATTAKMYCIYGNYEGTLLGARKDADGSWKAVTYPATADKPLPQGCPVDGLSQLLVYTSEWSKAPMAIMTGGRLPDGSLTGDTWAYDGSTWACISNTPISPAQGVALVPYFTYRVNISNWKVTQRTTLLSLGGRGTNGLTNKRVYKSMDRGVTWEEVDTLMCLPQQIPAFAQAQALVIPQLMQARSTQSDWAPIAAAKLPPWMCVLQLTPDSRRTTAPDEWECPYIYLFGGQTDDYKAIDTVWRGVINRLTFKPLY